MFTAIWSNVNENEKKIVKISKVKISKNPNVVL